MKYDDQYRTIFNINKEATHFDTPNDPSKKKQKINTKYSFENDN